MSSFLVRTRFIAKRLHRFHRSYQTQNSHKKLNKVRSLCLVSAGSVLAYVGGALMLGDERFYRDYAMPAVHYLLDGEDAHRLAVAMAKWNIVPLDWWKRRYPALETSVFGLGFATPVGLAAGFDKDGEGVDGIRNMGFSFVEVGSVTPLPQEGNPKPRVFRLPQDEAVINRYGFNSAGHDVVYRRLEEWRRNRRNCAEQSSPPPPALPAGSTTTSYTRNSLPEVIVRDVVELRSASDSCDSSSSDSSGTAGVAVLGVNLGKNKTSPSPIGDYVSGVEKFAPVADYLVVNVSSPNTPGLRDMQGKATLEALLDAVLDKLRSMPEGSRRKPPLLVKIAPDLADGDVDDVVQVLLERSRPGGVAGVIVSNTTISRPSTLQHGDTAKETGGLSGKPLRSLSTEMIKRVYRASGGKIPIIGCGGISSGADAYEKIRAGASLVQIYSALVFGGPPVVKAITRDLNELLVRDGFRSVEEAVGADSMDEANLQEMREFMQNAVLERFAQDQEDPTKASDLLAEPAEGDKTTTTTAIELDAASRESEDVLLSHYYDIPSSHMRTKKNLHINRTMEVPSAS